MPRFFLALLLACSLPAADLKLGEPLTLREPLGVGKLLAAADDYVGKTVQVKGKITEVCLMAGCWTMLRGEGGETVRVKVADGEIVFPREAVGREAVAEGRFVRFELSREQAVAAAAHEAEEQGRRFAPASVKGPQVIYRIEGHGAVVEFP